MAASAAAHDVDGSILVLDDAGAVVTPDGTIRVETDRVVVTTANGSVVELRLNAMTSGLLGVMAHRAAFGREVE